MTATIYVEYLIAGFGALLWILFFVAACRRWKAVPDGVVEKAKAFQFQAAGTVVLLAAAYLLGVITDRCADYLLSPRPIRQVLTSVTHGIAARDAADRRIEIMLAEGRASDFLDYIRVQVRILRSASFNVGLIGFSVAAVLWRSCKNKKMAGAVAGATLLLVLLMLFLYGASLSTWQQELEQAVAAQERITSSGQTPRR